jgi:drug/metabolite transporter (DMT)-like permease
MAQGIKYMLLSSFAFSLMHLCVKYIGYIPATELVLWRSVISILLCIPYFVRKGINPLGNNRKVLFYRGIFGTLALSLFFITIAHIPLASAVTIQYLSPIFTAFFAIFLMKEKTDSWQWMFFLFAFLGVFIMKGFDPRVENLYLVIGLISATFAGLAYNCVRKLKSTEDPLVVVFYFPLIALPATGLFHLFNAWQSPAALSEFTWHSPTFMEYIVIILMGIFTQIAQYFMTKGIQSDKAGNIMTVKYVGTVFALSYGYFFFNESYDWKSLMGIVLVLLGIILNVLYKKRKESLKNQALG